MAEQPTNGFTDFVNMNMRIYQGFVDLWGEAIRGMVLFTPFAWTSRSLPASEIVLSGKKDEKITGSYCIENKEFRTVKVRVSATSLEDEEGEGVETGSTVEIEPHEFELGPWQKKTVKLRVTPDDGLEEGKKYASTVESWVRTQSVKVIVRRVGD